MGDRQSLYAAAFVRSVSTGMIGVLLGVYLAELKLDATAIGVVIGVGLAGATLATLAVTVAADRIGHRRSLVLISLLSAGGAIALALNSHPVALGVAAFVGMVNGMGRDRGAALVLEQAVLPTTTTDRERTNAFSEKDLKVLSGIASQAAIALENADLAKKIEVEAVTRAELSRFLSPAVADMVVQGKVELLRVGRMAEVSVIFADIRGFTSMSESESPQETVAMLNAFFTRMAQVIFHHKGESFVEIGIGKDHACGTLRRYNDSCHRNVETVSHKQAR